MALTDENGMNTTMLVSPTGGYPVYQGSGNNGFGGGDSWAWIILLLLLGWGGNRGNFGGGGYGGGNGSDYGLYPWMNQANLTSNGFQNQLINDNISEIRNGVSNLSTQLCNSTNGIQNTVNQGFFGVQNALCNGFNSVEQGANARQMANMQTAFNAQTAMTQGFNNISSQFADCCCENRLGIADLKYTVATENCADRTAAYQNTRDIIDSQTNGTRAILDKLCQLELDGVKAQVEAKNNRISELQTQLNMANLAASQTRQTADIQNSIIGELRSCPIPSMPVFGNQPIFTCPNNNGGGCGCNGNF